jgi:hypothetical protein
MSTNTNTLWSHISTCLQTQSRHVKNILLLLDPKPLFWNMIIILYISVTLRAAFGLYVQKGFCVQSRQKHKL